MTPEETLTAQHEARMSLVQYAEVQATRDARIRAARLAGIGPAEIARLTGISRQHIYKIITPDGSADE